ncbi:hypothetical protein C8R47DRAFT_987935 [Mycena vitilis]|nr:hypothetical protein C8R47DRAFT_999594 [Mycena vitilis]KAJ6448798.1 hypothetical protein C8R47DRAFT_999415 [Mycena vitilis]KAJ6449611.1 hypothetical protein C8R47DRAFT_999147 [Mycena vitilis]KAJ6472213.1 hypothetical protein C8R47DRAFT_987935 [Mycena vitilis]
MQSALRKPHPHGVDLLRNRNPSSPLGPFDGNVGAFAELNGEHYVITTNADYVPALPSLQLPHAVYLRTNMRYGSDDPMLWPQQYAAEFCHLPLIAKKGSRSEIDIMWWEPSQLDFVAGSAITRGLGRLKYQAFSKLIEPINELVSRCTRLYDEKPELRRRVPLFGELMEHNLRMLEQLQSLPTTFPKLVFLVTSLQRAFLELDALFEYMTVYKDRMTNYMAVPPTSYRALPQFVGAFTTNPAVVQQLYAARIPVWFLRPVIVFDQENVLRAVPLSQPSFGLPDDNARAAGAPDTLYSGNSTLNKIMAIRAAALHTPWYHDPFETSIAPARAPSPITLPVASTSQSNRNLQHKRKSASSVLAYVLSSNTCKRTDNGYFLASSRPKHKKPAQKSPTKVDRDKFVVVTEEGMPPPVVSMAQALAKVNRSVVPYTSNDADKRYVLPEPALFITTTPQRRRKFLHHWSLLADGFIFTLAREPQLLRPQEWRDVLEGHMEERGAPGSTTRKRSQGMQERIRPALTACGLSAIEGLPVADESVPWYSVAQSHEIVWGVAETAFRFELCALDRRASGKERVDAAKQCFAGNMMVGVPLEMGKVGWAAAELGERHPYVVRTAALMLDWTTKSARPNIIRHVSDRHPWPTHAMQELENAVSEYYTQAFWEYFGRAAVIPMRLNHDTQKEEGEL